MTKYMRVEVAVVILAEFLEGFELFSLRSATSLNSGKESLKLFHLR